MKKIITTTLLAGSAVAIALLGAGTASAYTPEENALLASLDANTYNNVPVVISNAHRACQDLDNGVPSNLIASQIALATTSITQAEAVTFVNVAIANLCPQNAGK